MPTVNGTAAFQGMAPTVAQRFPFNAFGVSNVVMVPTTIDHVGVNEVTDDIQAFCDAQPDGSLIRFQPNGTYFCDSTLTFVGRKNLIFDLNGATIKSKHKFPFSYHYTDLTLTAPGDMEIWANVPPSTQTWHIGASEQIIYSLPGTPTLRNLDYDGVSDDNDLEPNQNNIPTESTMFAIRKESGYHAGVIGSNVQPPHGPLVPGSGLAVFFLDPKNGGLARFSFITDPNGVRCQNIKVFNGQLLGTNTAGAYDPQVVGQHGVDCKGVDGVEIGPDLVIGNVWGDGINIAVDNPAGPGTHLDPRPGGLTGGHPCHNVYIHDTEIHHNGRQGTSLTSVIGCLYENVFMHDTPRTGIDMEPPTLNPVMNVTIRNNTFENIGSGFVSFASYPTGNNVYIANVTIDSNITDNVAFRLNNTANPNTAVRWKNITITNNIGSNSSVPFGYSDGTNGYAIGVNQSDFVTVTGNTQYLQAGRPQQMFLVHGYSSIGLTIQDNYIVCGNPWAPHTSYVQAGPGVAASDVFDGISNSYACRLTHTSTAAGVSGNQPTIGTLYPTYWRSLQSSADPFPFGIGSFDPTDQFAASGQISSQQNGSATFFEGETFSATGKVRVRGGGTFIEAAQAVATGAYRVAALFLEGGTFRAIAFQEIDDNGDWRDGRVSLRGPGWDVGGWDEFPWGGMA